MYTIEEQVARRIACDGAVDQAKELIQSLYKLQTVELTYRIAPSPVSRGELTLFGLDSPRFAVRATWQHGDQESFVTLRLANIVEERLRHLQWHKAKPDLLQCGIRWHRSGDRVSQYLPREDAQPPRETYADAVRGNWIADCALVPPVRYKNSHVFLRARLGDHYGDPSKSATPYVRALRGFSGAACIQAAAQMSNLALADWPLDRGDFKYPPIVSLGDVTSIASAFDERNPKKWVRLSGFSLRRVCEFFSAVGRAAFYHKLECQENELASTFDGHIWSGCPIIVRVAMRRVLTDKMPDWAQHFADELDHAQVIVGCPRDTRKRERPYLVHDPSVGPFLDTPLKGLARWMEAPDRQLRFVSVFPKAVCVPLVNHEGGLGIKNLAVQLVDNAQRMDLGSQLVFYGVNKGDVVHHDWQLIEACRLPGRVTPCDLSERDPYQLIDPADPLLAAIWSRLVDEHKIKGRLCWLLATGKEDRKRPRVLSLWAADVDPAPPKTLDDFLYFVLQKQQDGAWNAIFERKHQADVGVENSSSHEQKTVELKVHDLTDTGLQSRLEAALIRKKYMRCGVKRLRTGLISSYRMMGGEHSLESWPVANDVPVQLYLCPGDDPLLRCGRSNAGPVCSPRELLSKLRTDDDLMNMVVDRICRAARANQRDLQICGLASFLPSVNLPDEDDRSAVNALGGLVRVANALNSTDCSRDAIRTIELVCGSTSVGLLPTHDPDDKSRTVLFQRFVRHDAALRIIVRNIETLLKDERIRGMCEKNRLRFALELEPGPTYTLNGQSTLEALAREIARDGYQHVQKFLGFNLDIAHFELAGIGPSEFKDWVHGKTGLPLCGVHISDHGVGHVSDLVIPEMAFGGKARRAPFDERLAAFREWIEEVAVIAGQQECTGACDVFDGIIAVELEAARDADAVRSSVGAVDRILYDLRLRFDEETPTDGEEAPRGLPS